jgi:AcrR family transcriptional regulator
MNLKKLKEKNNLKKKEYHHGDLRQALIIAAENILKTEGYESLTLRHCAKAAGVSQSAPAHHFKNLTGLLTAVATRGFQTLAADMKATLLELHKGEETDGLKLMARSYLKFARKNSALYRVMFSYELSKNDPDFNKVFIENVKLLESQVYARSANKLREPLEVAAFKTWAIAHGFIHLVLDERLHLVFGEKKTLNTESEIEDALFEYLL